MIDRLLFEAEKLLDAYMLRLNQHLTKAIGASCPVIEIEGPVSFDSENVTFKNTDIVKFSVHNGKEVTLYQDLQELTAAKLRTIRREIAKRKKHALPPAGWEIEMGRQEQSLGTRSTSGHPLPS